jgi:hypothetical protein
VCYVFVMCAHRPGVLGFVRSAALALCAVVLACSSSEQASSDAAVPAPIKADASVSDAACATRACAALCCSSPAQECMTGSCQCPASVFPAMFTTVFDSFELAANKIDTGSVGAFTGTDRNLHGLIIGYQAETTPLGVSFVLPSHPEDAVPLVAFAYHANVATASAQSTYFAQSGTLTLTKRCAKGVAGRIQNATFIEQANSARAASHPTPCSVTVQDLSFDLGQPCP